MKETEVDQLDKLDKLDLLIETINYVKEHGRSVKSNGRCLYISDEDESIKYCAISRLLNLSDEEKAKLDSKEHLNCDIRSLIMSGTLTMDDFQEKYRHCSLSFLILLQSLHDFEEMWGYSEDLKLEKVRISASLGTDLTNSGFTLETIKSRLESSTNLHIEVR